MSIDDFAERLKSKEVAKRDQLEGAAERAVRQKDNNAFIYANARAAFLGMKGIAEKLGDAANQRLSMDKYTVGDAAGGFYILLGAQSAGLSYSQVYQNAGEIVMSVLIQQRPSNFEMFGLPPTTRSKPTRQLTFEPVGDATSMTIAWRNNGQDYSAEELVESVMTTLMDRS